jgi:hypothetical protein
MSEIVKFRHKSDRQAQRKVRPKTLPASPALSGGDFLRPIAPTRGCVPPMPGGMIASRRARRDDAPHLRLAPRSPGQD